MIKLITSTIDNPWVIAGFYAIVFLVVVSLLLFLLLVLLIFLNTTYRNPFKKRTRECTRKKDELQMSMFSEGVTWSQNFKDKQEQLHLRSDGLNLYGEYINFGQCA